MTYDASSPTTMTPTAPSHPFCRPTSSASRNRGGAAASPWVAKEIDYWRATKPEGTLLPVRTEGEWEWDDAAGTFDWERSTAVPPALAGVFTEEPRHRPG